MPRNPYQYLLPVAPTAFVGRWSLVNQIVLDLAFDGGDSHAIIAGRRCGKSSLLNALAYSLRQPLTFTEASDWLTLPLTFDFKAATLVSAEAFFARILAELRRRVDLNTRRRPVDAWATPVDLQEGWFQELAAQPTLTLSEFEDAIGYILELLDRRQTMVRLVLLLDEVDEILDESWVVTLFNQLRALIYSSDLKSRIRLVLVGSHRFLDRMSDRGSPLWNVLKLHYLEVFDRIGFNELIPSITPLPEVVVEAVWQQSGGHPFLAQYLLHHLWARCNTGDTASLSTIATVDHVQHLVGRFHAEQITDLQGWVNGVGTIGLKTYHILCQNTGWLTEEQLVVAVSEPPLSVKRGLIALCYHGLAIHDQWIHYQCAGILFRTWCVHYWSPPAVNPTLDAINTPTQFPPSTTAITYVNTGGGSYIEGNVGTGGGNFTGRDHHQDVEK